MDLGERGGRTRMRKKNLRCKMFWGLACGVFLDACGLERKTST